MNIFVGIILAIIKKNFLFFKPFKRIREKFGNRVLTKSQIYRTKNWYDRVDIGLLPGLFQAR